MTYNVTFFGMEFTLNPVAFSIGSWNIYWYGIIIATGFCLAMIYGYFNANRLNINKDHMLDVVIFTVPVAIFCARLYYIIFDGVKINSIADFFGFGSTQGVSGLAIYGGVIGAFVIGGIICKLKKMNPFDMFDLAALGFLIGQGVGRWGNFMNQEAYGTFTGSNWWGMQSNRTISELGTGLVHPCFLYESIWCILGFVILHFLSKKRKFSGEVTLMYCSWYGFGRGFIEMLRTDSLMWGRIRVSCLLSFTICILGIIAIIFLRKKNAKETEYTSLFGDGELDIATQNFANETNKDSEE